MMKILLILGFFAVAVSTEDTKNIDVFIGHADECVKQLGLDPKKYEEIVKNIQNGKLPEGPKNPIENTQEYKCFLKCLMVKSGSANENGNLNVEHVQKDLAKYGIADTGVKECAKIQKEDKCDQVVDMMICIYDIIMKKQ